MEAVLIHLLLVGASISAGYSAKLRRLEVAGLGVALASIYILLANTAGDVRWGIVAVVMNLVAGAFTLGHWRGARLAGRPATHR